MTSKLPHDCALIDRQRQTPVALLGDHPVVHVGEPVELALQAETRDPADLARDVHHRLAQVVHADEPLVDQPEDEIGAAAPADGIAVLVLLGPVEQALCFEILRATGCGDFVDVLTRQPIEPIDIDAELIDRRDDSESLRFREREVFLTAAGSDVDDAGSFGGVDIVPGDNRCASRLVRPEARRMVRCSRGRPGPRLSAR